MRARCRRTKNKERKKENNPFAIITSCKFHVFSSSFGSNRSIKLNCCLVWLPMAHHHYRFTMSNIESTFVCLIDREAERIVCFFLSSSSSSFLHLFIPSCQPLYFCRTKHSKWNPPFTYTNNPHTFLFLFFMSLLLRWIIFLVVATKSRQQRTYRQRIYIFLGQGCEWRDTRLFKELFFGGQDARRSRIASLLMIAPNTRTIHAVCEKCSWEWFDPFRFVACYISRTGGWKSIGISQTTGFLMPQEWHHYGALMLFFSRLK